MKPMLAATVPQDLSGLSFPLIASPKLDGIRCLINNGVALSRTLKPLPNEHIQQCVRQHAEALQGFDGELIVGDPTNPSCMQTSMSGIMSRDGDPAFTFFTFDRWDRGATPFHSVLGEMSSPAPWVINHRHETITNTDQLERLELNVLDDGYEGLVLRAPASPYKFGRSTLRQQWMMKLKRFVTAEATVVGTTELLHNLNEPQLDFLGHTKRSSHQANKVGSGLLGNLVCQAEPWGQFEIGTGFTHQDRHMLWRIRNSLPGKQVTFKYFPVGVKDRPRHPVFLSFRDSRDIS